MRLSADLRQNDNMRNTFIVCHEQVVFNAVNTLPFAVIRRNHAT